MGRYDENDENGLIGSNVISDSVEIFSPKLQLLQWQLHNEKNHARQSTGKKQINKVLLNMHNAQETSKESSPSPQCICRFLVTNIEGAPPTSDTLSIDLLWHRDGLFDLINLVFECALQVKMLDSKTYDNNLWYLRFLGQEFLYGWGDYVSDPDQVQRTHVDEQDPGILSKLPTRLVSGQIGSFRGIMGSFDFVVHSLTDVRGRNKLDSEYPKAVSTWDTDRYDSPIPTTLTAKLECDFLTPEQKLLALKVRQAYAFLSGRSDANQQGRTKRPPRRQWTTREDELVNLLSHANFAVSWEAILQFGLLDRSEKGTSLRLSAARNTISGRHTELSAEAAIKAAKEKCLELFTDFVSRPLPETEQGFSSEIEPILSSKKSREQKDNGKTPTKKRIKIKPMKSIKTPALKQSRPGFLEELDELSDYDDDDDDDDFFLSDHHD